MAAEISEQIVYDIEEVRQSSSLDLDFCISTDAAVSICFVLTIA